MDDLDKAPEPGRQSALAAALMVVLAVMIVLSPRMLIYDERYYMESAWLLATGSGRSALLTTRLDVATGPVYPILHHALAELTGLLPPAIRWINWVCLAVALAANAGTIRCMGFTNSFARSAMLLAVPLIWPSSGLALTELPALALASLAVFCAAAACRAATARAWPMLVTAGVCGGLAVMARQTCAPGLIGFVLLAFGRSASGTRRLLGPALLAFAVSLAVIAPMVLAWHGLGPPWQANGSGVSIPHGVLAFVYLAVATLFIAPDYFRAAFADRPSQVLTLCLVAAGVLVAALSGMRFDVAGQLIERLPEALRGPLRLAIVLGMCGLAMVMIVATGFRAWERRRSPELLLLGLLTALLAGTAAGIVWQFSSRYVLAAFPFALLMLQPWIAINRWSMIRMAAGAALGLATLSGYYRGATPFSPGDYASPPPEVRAAMERNLGGLR